MTNFYVHLGEGPLAPEEADFPIESLDRARDEAVDAAREIMAEDLKFGRPLNVRRVFQIFDAEKNVVSQVTFSDTIPPDVE